MACLILGIQSLSSGCRLACFLAGGGRNDGYAFGIGRVDDPGDGDRLLLGQSVVLDVEAHVDGFARHELDAVADRRTVFDLVNSEMNDSERPGGPPACERTGGAQCQHTI